AVSESTRAFLIEHEGMQPARVTTIHNGIDVEKYRPRPELRVAARRELGLAEDAFVVAGVGRLTHQKNFALFLDVAAALPATHFIIAGTGEDDAALRAQARRLGIEHRVTFAGFVADTARL